MRPKRWNHPPLRAPTQWNLFSTTTSSLTCFYFWLVVVCWFADWWPINATIYLILTLFCRSIRRPNWWDFVFPHAPPWRRPLSNIISTNASNFWVDCCMASPNGGHLRPETVVSLYFCVCPILAPQIQTGEPNTARAHRMPRACY